MSPVARWWHRVLNRGGAEAAAVLHEIPEAPGHVVYLYGTDEELVDRLESYVTDGWAHGQRTILFAKHERAKALRLRLATWDLQDQVEIHDATWALQQFVRGRLADYKRPRGVEFVAELPKTATGKLQRFNLRSARNA